MLQGGKTVAAFIASNAEKYQRSRGDFLARAKQGVVSSNVM
jgi:hypothetical protein